MTKAVVFDLFETLITEWGHEKFTKRMMSEALHIPYEAFREKWETLHELQYRGGITCEDSLRQVCRDLCVSLDEKAVAHILQRRMQTKAACFECLHPEIIPLLEELRKGGYRLAILSNCSGEEVVTARSSILVPLVDCMILSYETGLCKPERAIYELAAEKLGVMCTDCVFIGDGGSRELYGAKDAGMKAYRAMWYIRQMPSLIREQPEFMALDEPMDVLHVLAE